MTAVQEDPRFLLDLNSCKNVERDGVLNGIQKCGVVGSYGGGDAMRMCEVLAAYSIPVEKIPASFADRNRLTELIEKAWSSVKTAYAIFSSVPKSDDAVVTILPPALPTLDNFEFEASLVVLQQLPGVTSTYNTFFQGWLFSDLIKSDPSRLGISNWPFIGVFHSFGISTPFGTCNSHSCINDGAITSRTIRDDSSPTNGAQQVVEQKEIGTRDSCSSSATTAKESATASTSIAFDELGFLALDHVSPADQHVHLVEEELVLDDIPVSFSDWHFGSDMSKFFILTGSRTAGGAIIAFDLMRSRCSISFTLICDSTTSNKCKQILHSASQSGSILPIRTLTKALQELPEFHCATEMLQCLE